MPSFERGFMVAALTVGMGAGCDDSTAGRKGDFEFDAGVAIVDASPFDRGVAPDGGVADALTLDSAPDNARFLCPDNRACTPTQYCHVVSAEIGSICRDNPHGTTDVVGRFCGSNDDCPADQYCAVNDENPDPDDNGSECLDNPRGAIHGSDGGVNPPTPDAAGSQPPRPDAAGPNPPNPDAAPSMPPTPDGGPAPEPDVPGSIPPLQDGAPVVPPTPDAAVGDAARDASDARADVLATDAARDAASDSTPGAPFVDAAIDSDVLRDAASDAVASDAARDAASDSTPGAPFLDAAIDSDVLRDAASDAVASDAARDAASDARADVLVTDAAGDAVASDARADVLVTDAAGDAVASDARADVLVTDAAGDAVASDARVDVLVDGPSDSEEPCGGECPEGQLCDVVTDECREPECTPAKDCDEPDQRCYIEEGAVEGVCVDPDFRLIVNPDHVDFGVSAMSLPDHSRGDFSVPHGDGKWTANLTPEETAAAIFVPGSAETIRVYCGQRLQCELHGVNNGFRSIIPEAGTGIVFGPDQAVDVSDVDLRNHTIIVTLGKIGADLNSALEERQELDGQCVLHENICR